MAIPIDDELYKALMALRKIRLEEVDIYERLLGLTIRTAELRKQQRTYDPPTQYAVELKHQQENQDG
jgi:hypothetical protein